MWRESMQGYLDADIVCSQKQALLQECTWNRTENNKSQWHLTGVEDTVEVKL